MCLRIAGAGESIMIFFFSGSRIHFLFFICVLFSILLFFYLLMYIYIHSCVTLITYLKIYSSPNLSFSLSFLFDLNSCFFRLLVCFITSRVLVFTSYYIGRYSNPRWFISLIFLFVLSILLLINVNDLFILILGWDGLGVISFLLILHYQTRTTSYSGLITLFTNRLGDSLLVLFICLFFIKFVDSRIVVSSLAKSSPIIVSVFLLGVITKSALFPFSRWLPAAIAAPTPISALVHSSTLVTAGLYLIIRFYSSLFPLCLSEGFSARGRGTSLIVLVSLFTSFYAGINSLVEQDLKKIVALSTLSHMGFIRLALFSGALSLAFFHLFSHALFKSLLFISVGELIVVYSHSQDKRFISNASNLSSHSAGLITFAVISLVGLPFVSGFYSKDYILESLRYSYISFFLYFVLLVNLFFTFLYSFIMYRVLLSISSHPTLTMVNPLVGFRGYYLILGLMTVLFSSLYNWVVGGLFYVLLLPPLWKLTPFIMFGVIVLGFYMFLDRSLTWFKNFRKGYFYLSSILFLTPLVSSLSSLSFFYSMPLVIKTWESGLLRGAMRRAGLYAHTLSSFSYYFFKIFTLSTGVYILFFCQFTFLLWVFMS